MIPFRVIRSGVLLTGLLAALAAPLPAAGASFTARLSPEQKTDTGLTNLTDTELAALDRLVAADVRAHRTEAPPLSDPFSQRYSEVEIKQAGLDRLTPGQLAKLDQLIVAAVAAAPKASSAAQPRERPRLRDDPILSEKGRLQVHGGMSLTMGWAEGGRNYREVGAWVSYFDPVTGLGLAFSYSRSSGNMFNNYYGNDYAAGPYLYAPSRASSATLDLFSMGRNEFAGDGASLRAADAVSYLGRGFRR